MTADQPPTIFGWTPTKRGIIAGGVVIAVVLGSLSLLVADLLLPGVAWLWLAAIPVLLVSASARLIWRRRRASPASPILMLGVSIKLANIVAIGLLGFATLAAFVVGDGHWSNLARAFVFDLALGAVLSVATAIAGNLAAFSTTPSPPSAPPA